MGNVVIMRYAKYEILT